jgi:hypothetical protein
MDYKNCQQTAAGVSRSVFHEYSVIHHSDRTGNEETMREFQIPQVTECME